MLLSGSGKCPARHALREQKVAGQLVMISSQNLRTIHALWASERLTESSHEAPVVTKPRATDLEDSAGGMLSRSTVRVLVYESVEASSGSGVEVSSVVAASAAAQQAGRQAGLSESSYNCYVPYA